MTKADLNERNERIKRTREAMARNNLDALLVAGKGHWWTGRGYLRYFTDFHLWGHDGLYLLPLSGEPALTLSSPAVAARIAARGWVTDARGDVFLVPKIVDAIKEKSLFYQQAVTPSYSVFFLMSPLATRMNLWTAFA
jgi:Xaa-Pro aminopeptidase